MRRKEIEARINALRDIRSKAYGINVNGSFNGYVDLVTIDREIKTLNRELRMKKQKLTNLSEEGIVALISGVVGILALLALFSCTSGSIMSCDELLGEERDVCLEQAKNRDNNVRYQMEAGNQR